MPEGEHERRAGRSEDERPRLTVTAVTAALLVARSAHHRGFGLVRRINT